jgi:hypothetical protein
MATVNYLLKTKQELSTIYVRLVEGRRSDVTASTGYTISPKYWSSAKGTIKQVAENKENKHLVIELETLKRKIFDSLNEDKGNGTPIGREWLESVISKFKDPTLDNNTSSPHP